MEYDNDYRVQRKKKKKARMVKSHRVSQRRPYPTMLAAVQSIGLENIDSPEQRQPITASFTPCLLQAVTHSHEGSETKQPRLAARVRSHGGATSAAGPVSPIHRR